MIDYSVSDARHQETLEGEPFHRYVFDDGTVWTEFHRTPSGYLLRFPGLADFEVSADGRRATAHPAIDIDAATIEHLYINQLVPLALSRQGRPAFHASVVSMAGGAVAFLGATGMGKSTLAASFALDDCPFLTDDALIVEERDGLCFSAPSHASLRLWEDSVEALFDHRGHAPSYISYSHKARLLAGGALQFEDEPMRLLAAYVLDSQEPEAPSIGPLSGSARHMAWVRNSFLLDIQDKDLLARHFDWTHRISSLVPTFTLDYARDYGMLPELRRIILAHASDLS